MVSGPSLPKGTFTTIKNGIKWNNKPANPQRYGCKLCGLYCDSCGKLNKHHRQNHALAICPVCKQQFSAPNIINCHMYTHTLNKQYQCEKCIHQFPFETTQNSSQLMQKRTWMWTLPVKFARNSTPKMDEILDPTCRGQDLSMRSWQNKKHGTF